MFVKETRNDTVILKSGTVNVNPQVDFYQWSPPIKGFLP